MYVPQNMEVTKQSRRNNSVNKRVARCAYDSLRGWQTGFPQAFHEVIDMVKTSARDIRCASLCVREMISLESCLNLGLYAGINGLKDWKVTLPNWMNKRWKFVCLKGLAVGIAYGLSKSAYSVPTK